MPIKPTSRYRGSEIYDAPGRNGDSHPTVPLRPPSPAAETAAVSHVLTAGEDFEYLAWRYFGSSDVWWQIADANPRRHPLALISGEKFLVPSPTEVGRIERSRRFK